MKIKPHIQAARAAHHQALETLAPGRAGLATWRKLARIERDASAVSVAYCNGEVTGDQWEAAKEKARAGVAAVFGGTLPPGFYLNSDLRGCALKLDLPADKLPQGMHRDMGGYGILAPVID